jgi:hypothetical protein
MHTPDGGGAQPASGADEYRLKAGPPGLVLRAGEPQAALGVPVMRLL